jgi:hypothetical protein
VARKRPLVSEELRPRLEIEPRLEACRNERLELAGEDGRAADIRHPEVPPAVVVGEERERLGARVPDGSRERTLRKVEPGARGEVPVQELPRRVIPGPRAAVAEDLAVEREHDSGLRIVCDPAVLSGEAERDVVSGRQERERLPGAPEERPRGDPGEIGRAVAAEDAHKARHQ